MQTAKHTTDRRSARTKATLQHALMSLIRKKRYEAISIKEICEAANVGRSTFYAHYTSKDHLKRSGLENLRKVLVHNQREALTAGAAANRRFGFSLALFQHAGDHLHLYRALLGGQGASVALGQIREILVEVVRGELGAASDVEVTTQYVVGGYMAVLTWWLDGGARLPPDRIDAISRRLAIQGVMPSA